MLSHNISFVQKPVCLCFFICELQPAIHLKNNSGVNEAPQLTFRDSADIAWNQLRKLELHLKKGFTENDIQGGVEKHRLGAYGRWP